MDSCSLHYIVVLRMITDSGDVKYAGLLGYYNM